LKDIKSLKEQNVNLLIVGATGVGKSSTINALFDTSSITKNEVATIGHGVAPQTKLVKQYSLGKLKIWDTPGLGDGINDNHFLSEIQNLLQIKSKDNFGLIDMAIVILDGSSKDIGTSIKLINNILIPHFGNGASSRILVAINKIDLIKGGRYWDKKRNKPLSQLEEYLDTLVSNIKSRILNATGVSIEPIIYSAGNINQKQYPYNLVTFINHVLQNLPNEKRVVIAKISNNNKENWENNHNSKEAESTLRKLLREGFRAALFAGVSSLFGGLFIFDT
jgi:predicted GTPase